MPIEIVPEVMSMTRQFEANECPTKGSFWIDRDPLNFFITRAARPIPYGHPAHP